MRTLILVDDEAITRDHIKETFPWEEWGYRIAGEAESGEEALELIRLLKPDVALVDITMPVMNGLELLKQLQAEGLSTKCVILTAHRDFDYVQQALAIGASGYVLKSPIDLADTRNALDKAWSEFEKESQFRTAAQSRLAIQTNGYPLRAHFFQQLLSGIYDEDQEIRLHAKSLGIRVDAAASLLLVARIDRLDDVAARYSEPDLRLIEFGMLEIIRESLQTTGSPQIELFPLHFGKAAILLLWQNAVPDREETREACLRVERTISPPLRDYLQLSVTLATNGRPASPSRIRYAYREAEKLFIHRFYNERSHTIFPEGKQDYLPLADSQRSELAELAERLTEPVDSPEARKGLSGLKTLLLRYLPDPAHVIGWFQMLGLQLRKEPYDPEWPDFTRDGYLLDMLEKLQVWLRTRDENASASLAGRPEIAAALRHIHDHLAHELTIEGIARQTGLSPSHFSYLFKKETGKSVIDYVLDRRIEAAKRYLREGKFRNYELAEKVGFAHYSYFSSMFKKLTGMSPNEYKRSLHRQI